MRTHSGKAILARLLALPSLVGLFGVSFMAGYSSSDVWPNNQKRITLLPPSQKFVKVGKQSATPQDAPDTTPSPADKQDDPVADYKDALSVLKQNYYGAPIDTKKTRKLTYEGVRGMLFSLRDQFTSFLDPDEWSQFHATTVGDFEGIGAYLLADGLFVKVDRPIEGGPAEKAGIQNNDLIVAVDGKSVKGKDINDVVKLIKGKRGTKVLLSVRRGKKPLTFMITRARVEPPIVQHWMEDNQAKIGHIVLKEFNEKSVDQMEAAYRDLMRQGMRGMVLDLRYNPGGLLEVAIDVASLFIPANQNKDLNNVVVYIREGSGKEQGRRLKNSEYTHRPMPLVVLVNDNSASASEIVTGAIKDYGVGTIMGGRTFGKGKVQTLFPFDDGSALRLTTALYFPPKKEDINFQRDEDGNRIDNTGGILPDIEVKQSSKWKAEDFKDKVNDTQLQKALVFLRARLSGQNTAQAAQQVRASH